jgi:phosphohistidine phosphatase
MTHLFLLRHGEALDARPGEPDESRRLSQEGEEEVNRVARGLKRLKIAPERIVTSPLPRALRTAEIVANTLGISDRLELSELLATGRPPWQVLDWLSTRREERLLLVGHNPGLSRLIDLLIGLRQEEPRLELKKGGVAALRSTGPGPFELRWIVTARLLDRLLG